MFTGVVEATGEVAALEPRGSGRRLVVRYDVHTLEGLREGDSIAVNGACLTVVAQSSAGILPASPKAAETAALHPQAESAGGEFAADLSPETLSRTNLGMLEAGALVNLERPLTPQTRLGGHLVQGHVDGLAEIVALDRLDAEGNHNLKVRIPRELFRYVAWKGSLALDGISLTVASLEEDIAGVAIIPFTFTQTNLHRRRAGEMMNLECDLLARYLERLLRPETKSTLTVERLIEEGF